MCVCVWITAGVTTQANMHTVYLFRQRVHEIYTIHIQCQGSWAVSSNTSKAVTKGPRHSKMHRFHWMSYLTHLQCTMAETAIEKQIWGIIPINAHYIAYNSYSVQTGQHDMSAASANAVLSGCCNRFVGYLNIYRQMACMKLGNLATCLYEPSSTV